MSRKFLAGYLAAIYGAIFITMANVFISPIRLESKAALFFDQLRLIAIISLVITIIYGVLASFIVSSIRSRWGRWVGYLISSMIITLPFSGWNRWDFPMMGIVISTLFFLSEEFLLQHGNKRIIKMLIWIPTIIVISSFIFVKGSRIWT